MFTGIIEAMAKVKEQGSGFLMVERPAMFDDVKKGSSIAVSGACLTVTTLDDCSLTFDVMPETLTKTTLGDLSNSDFVNLERALPAHGRFEGHVVQGHVEGTGIVVEAPTPGPSPESSPHSFSQSSIPRPLPPEEEGEREHTCRPYHQLEFAREMRKNPTEAENFLWEHLRHDELGVRFRRQFLCAGAIFDFYCPEKHLAIEVDGGIHQSQSQRDHDHARDSLFLKEFGIATLRFTNDHILREIHSVLETIHQHLHTPPPREEGLGVEDGGNRERRRGEVCVQKEGLGGEVESQDVRLTIRVPPDLQRAIVPKGSICLDGVSLTVAEVGLETFTVALIPTTLTATTLGRKRMGDRVNLETDILVRTLLALR